MGERGRILTSEINRKNPFRSSTVVKDSEDAISRQFLGCREFSSTLKRLFSFGGAHKLLLEGQPPGEKGDRFARFVTRLLPQTKLGTNFGIPELRSVKTHDKGIDLIARGKDGHSLLYIQAKKLIKSAQDIRDVLDGFNEFLTTTVETPGVFQYKLRFDDEQLRPHCLLFTLSRIAGIVKAYESRPSTTRELYERLKSEGRLHFIDGDEILAVLCAAFKRFSELPYKLTVNLETDVSIMGNVYIGVISSGELKRLYHQEVGEALFFENVRDFLGVEVSKQRGRTTPNQEIVKTIVDAPEQSRRNVRRKTRIIYRVLHSSIQCLDARN